MITFFGVNNRDHILVFQKSLIESLLSNRSTLDHSMSTESMGKNLSSFLCEKDNKRLLVVLDADDGSGGTPLDCKMNWYSYNQILNKYKPHDVIVLKSQVNRNPEYNQFYPFKEDVYPLGIFSNDPSRVFEARERYKRADQDVDVFFAGGYKHARNRPICWPKNRDIKRWWSGASVRGYEKLLQIKQRRPDIKFELHDTSLPPDQFYSLMRRSKVCIDLPGVGLSSRKFYECMVFGKCVVSLRQQFTPWPCEEDEHYISLGEDLDFETLESKIDLALKDVELRVNIEKNVMRIEDHLRLSSMVERARKIIENKISSMTEKFVLQH